MKKYALQIELISDLCVSDGGSYNSSLDTDICYDTLGFPFVPARRIKGCLRECVMDLNDWGRDIDPDAMFGKPGEAVYGNCIRIGNGYLEKYQDMKNCIRKDSLLFHPQNILQHFSYIRIQTAIDAKTGIADDTSLRTMRVAKKGLVFLAEILCPEEWLDDLRNCCVICTHIGLARTRGLGEVRMSLVKKGTRSEKKDKDVHTELSPGAVRLDYRIDLLEPVICKSVAGGESKTMDYIQGNQVFGILAEGLKKQKANGTDKNACVTEFLSKGAFYCSNAYIMADGHRCTEVPTYIYEVKNEKNKYVNELFPLPDECREKQLNAMKHCYTYFDQERNLVKKNVRLIERCHHKRPENKGIGRAVKKQPGQGAGTMSQDSRMYQMSAMEEGQSFSGFITGTPEQICTVYNILTAGREYFLGYARNAEYGKVRITVTGTVGQENLSEKTGRYLLVTLHSPAVVYNRNAFYSTDAADLLEEILSQIPIETSDIESIRTFLKYVTLGGYNTTWNCRKPTVEAFDQGTSILIKCKEEITLPDLHTILLGERLAEGYGEASVMISQQLKELSASGTVSSALEQPESQNPIPIEDGFVRELCEDMFSRYIKSTASVHAKGHDINTEKLRPTVSNMLLMCHEAKQTRMEMEKKNSDTVKIMVSQEQKQTQSFMPIRNMVQARFDKSLPDKKKKEQAAYDILDKAEKEISTLVKNFQEKYKISGFSAEKEAYEIQYLSCYLNQLKYMLRKPASGGGRDES